MAAIVWCDASQSGPSTRRDPKFMVEFVDVSGAGHMVAGDRNDAFTAAIIDFIGD